MSRVNRRSAAAAMTAALALAVPLCAQAADAMRVVRDPLTGELRGPTAAEARAFEKAEAQLRAANRAQQPAKAAPTGPVEIHHPDGSVETKLGDDTMMYSVATVAADGSLRMDCLPAAQAQRLMQSSAAKKPSQTATTAAKAAAHDHQ